MANKLEDYGLILSNKKNRNKKNKKVCLTPEVSKVGVKKIVIKSIDLTANTSVEDEDHIITVGRRDRGY